MESIVVIGGGTGSYTVLRGLKNHNFRITAIATMFDSGGSTGMLRDEFGMLPPGDIRRCLVALADEREDVLRKLFMFRFEGDSSLKGHSFGNLFLAALTRITGSEKEAIKAASRILRIKGTVLPVSTDRAELCALLENGTVVRGETNIDIPKHNPDVGIKRLHLDPQAKADPDAAKAIGEADVIVLGPGDLYTSVVSNLIVEGIPEAIRNSKAVKVYVCNLMTKRGETTGYDAAKHAEEITRYMGRVPDIVICNTGSGPEDQVSKYAKEGSYPVAFSRDVEKFAGKVIASDLVGREMIRHDSRKLALLIASIARRPVLVFDLDDTLYSRSLQLNSALSNLERIKPFAGVREILADSSYTRILVSKGEEALQRRKLEILGIGGMFDEIHICPEDALKKQAFKSISKRFTGRSIVVVGNRRDSEIKYGNELEMTTILMDHGHYRRLKPMDKSEEPDYTISRFSGIFKILEGMDGLS